MRTDAERTDAELFAQQEEAFWYIDFCVEQLHRLPTEINPILTCRAYTELQAYSIVKQAMNRLIRDYQE